MDGASSWVRIHGGFLPGTLCVDITTSGTTPRRSKLLRNTHASTKLVKRLLPTAHFVRFVLFEISQDKNSGVYQGEDEGLRKRKVMSLYK